MSFKSDEYVISIVNDSLHRAWKENGVCGGSDLMKGV